MAIKLIKDPILGNIEFSKFEENFFYNPLINRLHNVIQNSMAYRVYPSVRTSRFAHSVGVMYLASRIFQSGIANSDENVLERYLQEKSEFLEKYLFTDQDGKNDYPDLLQRKIQRKIKEEGTFEFLFPFLEKFFGDEYIAHVSCNKVTFLNNKHLFVVYLILQQSTRLYALTHDLGHLPFSHLTEFAIENLEYYLSQKRINNNLNDNENYVLSIIRNLTGSNDQIHELLGKKIIRYIFMQIMDSNEKNDSLSGNEELAFALFTHLICITLIEIKKKEVSSLSSLLGLVSGDLEADRMDFIMRDGLYSGLVYKTGDIDRVIKMFCLCEEKDENNVDNYRFLPSIQSLNDVQEILFDRFRIYKYLVNHHKVKKLDYSVSYALELMLRQEIEQIQDIDSPVELGSNNLVDLLKSCQEMFDLDNNFKLAISLFLQLSDNWLLSILNERYIKLLTQEESPPGGNDQIINCLLEEIFTGCKNFVSLWKRDQEYHDFLREFSNLLLTEEIIAKAKAIIFDDKEERLKKELIIFLNKDEQVEIRMFNFVKAISTIDKNWNQHLQEWFDKKNEIVLCCYPKLNRGIENLKLVDLKKKDNKFLFKKKSSIYNLINNEINSSLQFFVYYFKETKLSENDIKKEIIEYFKTIFIKINL